jgi:hypothetical protein
VALAQSGEQALLAVLVILAVDVAGDVLPDHRFYV